MNEEQTINIEEHIVLRTNEIADNLNIGESTVRKYCNVLEKKGYSFRRDENNGRVYTERDQVALLELIKLRRDAKMGLDAAADIVATRRREKHSDVAPTQSVQPSSEQALMLKALEIVRDEMRSIQGVRDEFASLKNDSKELVEGVRVIVKDREQYKDGFDRAMQKLDQFEEMYQAEKAEKEKLKRELEELKEQQENSFTARLKKATSVLLKK